MQDYIKTLKNETHINRSREAISLHSSVIYEKAQGHHTNGMYLKSIIFREHDDTYLPFKCDVIIIKPNDLPTLLKTYEEYKGTHNIVIDSRLYVLITYALIKYGDDLLIYDPFNVKLYSIYTYCSQFFKIQTNELNIYEIKELFIIKLIVSVFFHTLNFNWNINTIIEAIKNNTKINNASYLKSSMQQPSSIIATGLTASQMNKPMRVLSKPTVADIIINKCIGYVESRSITPAYTHAYNCIKEMFSEDMLDANKCKEITVLKIPNLTIADVLHVLKDMKNQHGYAFFNAF